MAYSIIKNKEENLSMPKVTLIAPLNHVACEVPIDLGSDVEIHAYNPRLSDIVKSAKDKGMVRNPDLFSHCLVVKNINDPDGDMSKLRSTIEEIVLRLRLYKTGSIGFSFVIVDQDGWYEKMMANPLEIINIKVPLIGVLFYTVWARPGFPHNYEILTEDIAPITELLAHTHNLELMHKPAFRYFFRSFHEPYGTDRFLSNAIGLENLLVNDTSEPSNLIYKFVDRGCFLLTRASPHVDGPQAYASILTKIYKARSNVVHSKKESKGDFDTAEEIEILIKSEEYLRLLLKYIIDHPEMGDSKEVDNAKRLKYS
jgi:hypothetical protein